MIYAHYPCHTCCEAYHAQRIAPVVHYHAQRSRVLNFTGLLPVHVVQMLVTEHAETVEEE